MVPYRQPAPRVTVHSGRLSSILPAAELVQEPVDGVHLIADVGQLERRAHDQRPGRPPGVEFYSDAAKQVIDLGRVVTSDSRRPPSRPPTSPAREPDAPDLVPIHRQSWALVLMGKSVT